MKGGVLTPQQEVQNKEISRGNRQEIVCRPPGYLSDDLWMDSETCMITGEPFTWRHRRHHCRTCGIVVCGEKSEKQRVHKYIDKDTKRILSDDSNQRRCQWCIDDTTDYSLNCIPEFANVQSRLYWAMGADKYGLSYDVVNSVGDLLVELHKSQEKKHQKTVKFSMLKGFLQGTTVMQIMTEFTRSFGIDPDTGEVRVTIYELLTKLKKCVKKCVRNCKLVFIVDDQIHLTEKQFVDSSSYLQDVIRINIPVVGWKNVGTESKEEITLNIHAWFKYQQGE